MRMLAATRLQRELCEPDQRDQTLSDPDRYADSDQRRARGPRQKTLRLPALRREQQKANQDQQGRGAGEQQHRVELVAAKRLKGNQA